MKYSLSLVFLLCALPNFLAAQIGIYQHGSVVRMKMGDCILAPHGFMSSFGATAAPQNEASCPQYTLLSNEVVYVIVGKSSNQLIPLAEIIDFRFHKNELAVRMDDARHESRFAIKEMMFRSEWEKIQRHIDEQIRASDDHEASIKRD